MTARGWTIVLALALMGAATPASGHAQIRIRDLVITGGVAVEGYEGNLAAVTVPVVDSTEQATAGVGEFGLRTDIRLYADARRALDLRFDGGMRQLAATGFQIRDYAPREWVGNLELAFVQRVASLGTLQVEGSLRGRRVQDRPPMPLFLQPGYASASGAVEFQSRSFGPFRWDLTLAGERSDYRAVQYLPQLDLLDHRTLDVEMGLRVGGTSSVRLFGAYGGHHYPRQGSFDPDDPFRRDRTLHAGLMWTWDRRSDGDLLVQLGLEGAFNRSNSRRPEYDAVIFRGVASKPLGDAWAVQLYGVLTAKEYLYETPFVRLVPGEEADNASQVYLQLSRALAANLDGSLRLGWTRAETDIGDSYYERLGASFFLNFRPLF